MPLGRKGKFEEWRTESALIALEGFARDGLTDEQIAREKIGIHPATLCEWKNRFPEIDEALKKGKAPVDTQVENALLKRARGYITQEVKEYRDENGEITQTVIRTFEVAPDTTAQIFWLKNRRPDRWRDKHEVQDTTALDKLDSILETQHELAIQPKAE